MVSVWSFEGFIIFSVLAICTCAYLARTPKIKNFILAEKHGVRGTFYKAAVVGIRLHWIVAIICVVLGVYKLLF
ncbi:Conserved_hypothetical protein [Hexamita inflata]|uniref:Protein kish n=1 Tax=Hexamita inflata TaxID=28002 RepID=A0AA86NI31_9EUKA|nr:Conserved hypothetical protein [Hexamita inflata]CAI9930895.1 Conserved hypothetical protein [Hexamita inflata]